MNMLDGMLVRVAVSAAILLAAADGSVRAQTAPTDGSPATSQERSAGPKWTFIDAVGYAGLGFGAGLAATWDLEGSGLGPPGEALAVVAATTLAGGVTGAVLGRRAESAAARGRRVGGLHRAAVLGGAALAGGTLGALAAAALVNPSVEGTPLGSDEQTVTLLVLAGTGAGAAYAWSRSEALESRSLAIAPVFLEGGRRGVRVVLGRSTLTR